MHFFSVLRLRSLGQSHNPRLMPIILLSLTLWGLMVLLVSCGGGPLTTVSAAGFMVTSTAISTNGELSAVYTCDGNGSSPAVNWSGAPAGTQSYAIIMSTLTPDGTTKYNWLVYDISSIRSGIEANALGIGMNGVGSDGPIRAYQPPCSQGLGTKNYAITVYALSTPALVIPTNSIPDGSTVLAAMRNWILAQSTLSINYSRNANATGGTTECQQIRSSIAANASQAVSVNCDAQYAYMSSFGLPSHEMMNGIVATNLQVPIAQNFWGSNAWRIPLRPAIVGQTSVVDGPLGVAVNGIPIFNPCKQGGCSNGDTKQLGELDGCNGHAGRADDYHYHAAPVCLMNTQSPNYWDTHPLGWALDGFAIYGYNHPNGNPVNPLDRDICGGVGTNDVTNGPAGYRYHVSDVSPYIAGCLVGTPSPDLTYQSLKFSPIRKPPVTPFNVASMTLQTNLASNALQFTSPSAFNLDTGSSTTLNLGAGTYRIQYRQLKGAELEAVLQTSTGKGKANCWQFRFGNQSDQPLQSDMTYCR
jgi:phosphatidylethanolamine-binding protein (PEBP) family uncharacterized protein